MTLILTAMLVAWVFVPVASAELVGFWPLDGRTGDFSGNGYDGALMGGASFVSSVPPVYLSGESLRLNGGTDHVLVPHHAGLNIGGAITIAAWINAQGGSWNGILAKNPSAGSAANHAGNYEFRVEATNRRLQFLYQPSGVNNTLAYTSTSPITNDAWQHVAVTLQNGAPVRFYIDGSLVGSVAHANSFGTFNSNPLYIGNRADMVTGFNGMLRDVVLYNHVLSQVEIIELSGREPPPPVHPHLAGVLARASSEDAAGNQRAANAVNGAGLIGAHHGVAAGGTMWQSAFGDVNATFDIDLRAVHAIDHLRIYNYNAQTARTRGIQQANVFVAAEDGVFGATPLLAGVALAQGPGVEGDFSQVISLGGAEARYVRIAAVSNWGDPSQTGLAEVQVQGTPVAGRGPLPATIHSVSSDLGAPFSRRAAYLVNGAGMLFADGHTTIPDGFMWLTTGTLQAPNDLSPEVTFDLGEVVTIDRMKVWNYNEYRPDLPTRVNELLGRGVATADVLVAGEDLMFTTLYAGYEFNRAPTTLEPVDYHQVVPLGVEARYVKLRILSNHNGKDFTNPLSNDALGNHAGLSEVQFFGTSRPSADLNGDGRVDRRDVLAMMANYGRFPDATLEQGDLNDDGAVGLSDLYRMQRQLTDPPAAGAAAVPEPQALVLLLAGLAGGWVGARRRRFKGC